MNQADPLLVETVERLLADVCTPEVVEHAEVDGWSAPVWSALTESGFPLVGVTEEAGGSGGSLYDMAAILRSIGRYAAPVPIAETGMLAGWLLSESGLSLPDGPTTVVDDIAALTLVNGRVQGQTLVAWARHAERIVALVDGSVIALRHDQVEITPGANIAGEARDQVHIDISLAEVEHGSTSVNPTDLTRRGALSRVVMAAGALGAMAQMTVDYTNDRRQFGKPVATFQAVQHHLVLVAQSAVRVQMAADIAVRALATGVVGIEIAAARVIMDDAITIGTRAAHQAHGAMGVTREYPLHHLTRRLWSWRHEWGTTSSWRRQLGAAANTTGADRLYSLISG